MTLAERFARLPTAAKLLLILTAVLLPIGLALTWVGQSGIRQAKSTLEEQASIDAQTAGRSVESLIARNALAMRIAANAALAGGTGGACDRARSSLAIAPAVAQSFELEDGNGKPLCVAGDVDDTGALPLVAPGDIRVRVAPGSEAVAIRTGVNGGMATALIGVEELKSAVRGSGSAVQFLILHDEARELRVIGTSAPSPAGVVISDLPIGNGTLKARIGIPQMRLGASDRLLLLLPVIMWIAAALLTWLLVSRLLIRPLKKLERSVRNYQPGNDSVDLPTKLGPSEEIQELRDAFSRALTRVNESEREMSGALEGQRRLVREVHHRVKNNLQVVASLLNIHGRSAETTEARAAYAGIGRRVGALSIVHRNHFAEMEENRGIALRPLLSELAAELRATAPEEARALRIDLDLDTIYTTQDVAVATAFLITEIVEFAMLNCPQEPIEVSIRRTSELTARLTISSPVLVPENQDEQEKIQFERIVGGLAKQLRSPLDRKLGRYSVDLPAFPPA
ncbi:MAG: histidine kinase dimerization/phosphoacceptor domain -containing protein [Pseudomonadota bacterium]